MGQKLYFDNYTAAGDILVIAICFVIGMYYKMLGTVRSKEIPFHFLHVQNTNQVIENIYSVVKAEVE
jgi:hypothetical protein